MKLHVHGRQQDLATPLVANVLLTLTGQRLREMPFALAG